MGNLTLSSATNVGKSVDNGNKKATINKMVIADPGVGIDVTFTTTGTDETVEELWLKLTLTGDQSYETEIGLVNYTGISFPCNHIFLIPFADNNFNNEESFSWTAEFQVQTGGTKSGWTSVSGSENINKSVGVLQPIGSITWEETSEADLEYATINEGTFLKISDASETEFETYINIWSDDWKTNHAMIQPVINPSDLANLDNVYAFIPFLGSSDSYSLYFQPNPEPGTSDTTLASNFTKGSTSSISITPIHS